MKKKHLIFFTTLPLLANLAFTAPAKEEATKISIPDTTKRELIKVLSSLINCKTCSQIMVDV